jgi:hypothetical protein
MTDTADFNRKHPRKNNLWTDKTQSADELGQVTADLSPEDRAVAVLRTYAYTEKAARDTVQSEMRVAAGLGFDAESYADYVDIVSRYRQSKTQNFPTLQELRSVHLTVNDMEDVIKLNRGRYSGSLRRMIVESDLTAARITELAAAGVPQNAAAMVAMRTAPPAIAGQWAAACKNPQFKEWLGGWDDAGTLLRSGISAQTAVEYSEAGVDVSAVIRTQGRFTPEYAREFAEASGLEPHMVGAYLVHNNENAVKTLELVAPAVAREYGPSFGPAEVAELARQKTDPKAARNLRTAGRYRNPQEMHQLIGAGIVTGIEYRQLLDSVDVRGELGDATVAQIIAAKRGTAG